MTVSEIGFGPWGIGGGWGARQDDAAIDPLRRAIDLGVNFIDTAFRYGEGHSERLIGQVLRDRAETVHVATKVPPVNRRFPADADTGIDDAFPKGHIRAHTERSLADLGVHRLDVAIKPGMTFEPGDWRRRYFRDDRPAQVHERVSAIVDDLGIDTDQLPETALRYVLSPPAVSSVIVGMRSIRNVERNARVGEGRGLPAEQVQRLHRHRWVRNFYA